MWRGLAIVAATGLVAGCGFNGPPRPGPGSDRRRMRSNQALPRTGSGMDSAGVQQQQSRTAGVAPRPQQPRNGGRDRVRLPTPRGRSHRPCQQDPLDHAFPSPRLAFVDRGDAHACQRSADQASLARRLQSRRNLSVVLQCSGSGVLATHAALGRSHRLDRPALPVVAKSDRRPSLDARQRSEAGRGAPSLQAMPRGHPEFTGGCELRRRHAAGGRPLRAVRSVRWSLG